MPDRARDFTLAAASAMCTLVTWLRRRITSPTPNRLARPFWSPWGHPATPPQLLSIARLPPQRQVASLPNYPTRRLQPMPDSLSMTPPWTPNTWQHHWCHLHPHPLQWMWMRPLPHQVVEIWGHIHDTHPNLRPSHGLRPVGGGVSLGLPPGLHLVGEGVSRIYSTSLLILLQHSVLQYFLLYILLWVP